MAGYAQERDEAIAETFAITRAIGALPEPNRFLELEMQLARALDREAQQLGPLTDLRGLNGRRGNTREGNWNEGNNASDASVP